MMERLLIGTVFTLSAMTNGVPIHTGSTWSSQLHLPDPVLTTNASSTLNSTLGSQNISLPLNNQIGNASSSLNITQTPIGALSVVNVTQDTSANVFSEVYKAANVTTPAADAIEQANQTSIKAKVIEPSVAVVNTAIENTSLPLIAVASVNSLADALTPTTVPEVTSAAEPQTEIQKQLQELYNAVNDYNNFNKELMAPVKTVEVNQIVAGPVTEASNNTACCDVRVNNACMIGSFADIVATAKTGDTITLFKGVTVTTPISITSDDLTITAGSCDGSTNTQQTISVDMNGRRTRAQEASAFHTHHDNQKLVLENLHFTRSSTWSKNKYGTALWADYLLDLSVKNCRFEKLRSPINGGSAIYVKTATNMLLDRNSEFIENTVDDGGCVPGKDSINGVDCYGGGGAVWLSSCFSNNRVNIESTFKKNVHEFGHGMGGGLFVDWMACHMTIDGVFDHNTAADGAGLHIESVEDGSVLNIDGQFTGNDAHELRSWFTTMGYGARGGAVRVREIRIGSKINIKGDFTDNHSDGKGGALSMNNLHGSVTVDINARGNSAKTGGVVSLWKEFTGRFRLESRSSFSRNKSSESRDQIVSFQGANEHLSEKQFAKLHRKGKDYSLRG